MTKFFIPQSGITSAVEHDTPNKNYTVSMFSAPKIHPITYTLTNYVLANQREINNKTGLPYGITNISEHIKQGNMEYHPKTRNYRYFRDPQTGEIYADSKPRSTDLNLSKVELIPNSEILKMYPKRDYMGGTPKESRLKALNKIPGLKDYIKNTATKYNIDPNLLLHRFLKEGYLDYQLQEYNNHIATVDQQNFWNNVANKEVNGFGLMGMDDFQSNFDQNFYDIKDNISFDSIDSRNEKGRTVHSAVFPNLWQALIGKAADLEYRKKQAIKQGIPEQDLNTYVNAMYNLGVNHKDLNNHDYIVKNYTVPTYFRSGGVFPNYLKMFNCDLINKMKKHDRRN